MSNPFGYGQTYVPQFQQNSGQPNMAPQSSPGGMFADRSLRKGEAGGGSPQAAYIGAMPQIPQNQTTNPMDFNSLLGNQQTDFKDFKFDPRFTGNQGYQFYGPDQQRLQSGDFERLFGHKEKYNDVLSGSFQTFMSPNQQFDPTKNSWGDVQKYYQDYFNNLNAYKQNVLPGVREQITANYSQQGFTPSGPVGQWNTYLDDMIKSAEGLGRQNLANLYDQFGQVGSFGSGYRDVSNPFRRL